MSLQLFAESVDRKKHGWKISLGVTALFFLLLDIGGRVYRARAFCAGVAAVTAL